MPDKKKRQRPTQLHFYVNDQELEWIKQKMTLFGTENMSAYLRKLAIDGYVIKLDIPELRELTALMGRISNSENQIAKKLNATDRIYDADIEEIKKNQAEIYSCINKILMSLAQLD